MGPMAQAFEGELAKYHGTKFGIAWPTANRCHLAGADGDWESEGDEVITHPNIFSQLPRRFGLPGRHRVRGL